MFDPIELTQHMVADVVNELWTAVESRVSDVLVGYVV